MKRKCCGIEETDALCDKKKKHLKVDKLTAMKINRFLLLQFFYVIFFNN